MNHPSNMLIEDVNVDRLSLSNDGRSVTIDFLNMVDGKPCAQLVAEGVSVHNYHNAFSDPDDGLAAYVGEVTWRELGEEEFSAVLVGVGYGFHVQNGEAYLPTPRGFHIHIEGGELDIDIVCRDYKFTVKAV